MTNNLLSTFSLLVVAGTAYAQVAPELGYIYPPAMTIGQANEVQLGGFEFTDDIQWFVHDERIRLRTLGPPGEYQLPPPPYWIGPRASTPALPIPREVAAVVEVDAASPAGFVRWQVANANGGSSTAVFYVSRGREIVEARSRDFPQRLPALPVAVSGRLSRLAEVDRYQLIADRDGPISVDLMARRLGADFHGVLQVRDDAGTLLADLADTQGVDGGVTFTAKAGSAYTISLHDVDFRGDRAYVYRLAVTRGPRVVCTLPACGQRGTTREIEVVGVGVASGEPVLESVRQTVSFPVDPALLSYTHPLETPFGSVDVTIPLSGIEELTADSLPSQSPESVVPIVTPAAVTRLMLPDVDEHRYSWRVAQDESWSLEAQARAIGGRLDVALAVLDPEGKLVAEVDDLPGTPDAGLEFRAAASGMHTCVVRSVSSRLGAADELYRLQVQRVIPDFSLTAAQQVNLPLGGQTEVTIQAVRSGGFTDDIQLSVSGLPAGITPQGDWTIPAGKNEAKVSIVAASDAAVSAKVVHFHGTGRIGESLVTRQATAAASGNLCPRRPGEQRTETTLLAVTMTPPFELQLVDGERQREVHRGTTYSPEFQIVRKEGFAGEIQLQMAARQSRNRQGIRGPIIRVPADVDRALYPCFMPEWLGTDLTRRMVVHGVAAVPDPQGNMRYLVKPADKRVTMIMEGALLKLSAELNEPDVELGDSFEVPVVVSRSAKLPISTTVELIVPEEVSGLLRADRLILPPGRDRGTLRISTAADARLEGPWSLTLTATALRDGKWPVISETAVHVSFASRR